MSWPASVSFVHVVPCMFDYDIKTSSVFNYDIKASSVIDYDIKTSSYFKTPSHLIDIT